MRLWRALELKKADIPVMELINSLEDALALRTVEVKVEDVLREKAREEAQRDARERD